MKKRILKSLLLSCFSIMPTLCFSQAWAETGTTWHYNAAEFEGSYYKLTKVSDTVINGIVCDNIERKSFYINSDMVLDSSYWGNTYTYFKDSTVYVWHQDRSDFQILYKLNGKVGDEWVMYGDDDWDCQDSAVIRITEVGWTPINGQNLRYIKTTTEKGELRYPNMIIDKIGCLSYLLPIQYCVLDIEVEGTDLRCFSNNDMFYDADISPSCEYTERIGVEDLDNIKDISIHPNPASNQIRISTLSNDTNQQIDIYNTQGQFIHSYQILGKEILIDISNYNTGVYVILSPNGTRSKFIKM